MFTPTVMNGYVDKQVVASNGKWALCLIFIYAEKVEAATPEPEHIISFFHLRITPISYLACCTLTYIN